MKTRNRKRPGLVWAAFLYYLITILTAAWGLIAVWHAKSYSVAARTAIGSITTLGWTLIGLKMVLELGGAIALFKLRRIAFPLFAGGLCVAILQLITQH